MQKFLLLLISLISATVPASAKFIQDVISAETLGNPTDKTVYFSDSRSFTTDAVYGGYIEANKEGILYIDKNSDCIYVFKPAGKLHAISATLITEGSINVYCSTRKISMSGGSPTGILTNDNGLFEITDDYEYFILRNPGAQLALSSIVVTWEVEGEDEDTPEVPEAFVDGVKALAGATVYLNGEKHSVTFKCETPDATVMYKWQPEANSGNKIPFETAPEEGVTINEAGTLTYYAAKGDFSSERATLTFTGTGYVSIDNLDADSNDGSVEYFNILGIKVENPQNGIFIRRQNNKTTKVKL